MRPEQSSVPVPARSETTAAPLKSLHKPGLDLVYSSLPRTAPHPSELHRRPIQSQTHHGLVAKQRMKIHKIRRRPWIQPKTPQLNGYHDLNRPL